MKKALSILLPLLLVFGTVAFSLTAAAEETPAYAVGDHIQFGTYPQTQVEETEDLAAAAAAATWKSYGYYSGNNKYVCQNYWLDSKSGSFSVRHDLPPTGTEWTRYCLDLSAVENPRTGKVDMQVEKLGGIRLGGNPAAKELSFWVRKAYLLKRPR